MHTMLKEAPTYRTAVVADHPVVVRLFDELVVELGAPQEAEQIRRRLPDDITAALAAPEVEIFLAEVGTGAIGLCRGDVLRHDPIFRLRPDCRCGYVDQMFVQPAYRHQGVGAQLLALCEDWFRAQGIAHCLLHTAPKAVRFYARTGYQPNREMFKKL